MDNNERPVVKDFTDSIEKTIESLEAEKARIAERLAGILNRIDELREFVRNSSDCGTWTEKEVISLLNRVESAVNGV
jgi:hypothetical protein